MISNLLEFYLKWRHLRSPPRFCLCHCSQLWRIFTDYSNLSRSNHTSTRISRKVIFEILRVKRWQNWISFRVNQVKLWKICAWIWLSRRFIIARYSWKFIVSRWRHSLIHALISQIWMFKVGLCSAARRRFSKHIWKACWSKSSLIFTILTALRSRRTRLISDFTFAMHQLLTQFLILNCQRRRLFLANKCFLGRCKNCFAIFFGNGLWFGCWHRLFIQGHNFLLLHDLLKIGELFFACLLLNFRGRLLNFRLLVSSNFEFIDEVIGLSDIVRIEKSTTLGGLLLLDIICNSHFWTIVTIISRIVVRRVRISPRRPPTLTSARVLFAQTQTSILLKVANF